MVKAVSQKPLMLGDIAPDFSGDTTMGWISFHEWIGSSWCVFFPILKILRPFVQPN